LEFRRAVCREIHTEATIAEAEQQRIELQGLIKEKLGDARGGRGWKLLKFWALRKFPRTITEVASYIYTCASHQEVWHKALKAGAQHTNNRLATMGNQMSAYAAFAAGIQRVLEATEGEPTGRHSMVRSHLY